MACGQTRDSRVTDTLDLTRAHILTAPHQIYGSGMWFAWCTCGEEFSAGSPDGVRDDPEAKRHRDAERQRAGVVADQERLAQRQRRIQAGRAQRKARSNVESRRSR